MLMCAGRFFLTFYTLCTLTTKVTADPRCVIDPESVVNDACISYTALDALNKEIAAPLDDLTHSDFFAYYRLNLFNKVCPFWNDENSMCGNRACAVDTIDDEKDIPLIWRTEELSKLEGARAQHPGPQLQKQRPKTRPLQYQLGENVDESCVFEADDECDERDYCVPEDEGAASKGDYVSLINNTERFTGYSGQGARQVWDAIYKENCFTKGVPRTSLKHVKGGLQAAVDLRNVFQEYGRQHVDSKEDDYPLDDQCIEQRAFYRIISGMHASISTHICWDYFNQTTGEWVTNLQCYKDRLHNSPERISNLYFNYAIVTRALAKVRRHLQSYTFCSGDPEQDYETKQKVLRLTNQLASAPRTFDETGMFQDPAMLDLKDDFKQRFRNVSRIMDCVGCDKCRLWGKVQTAGYGAALKVLFEFDETKNGENPDLRRTELVALVNTFGRLSHSIEAIRKFRQMVQSDEQPRIVPVQDLPKSKQSQGFKEKLVNLPASVAAYLTDTPLKAAATNNPNVSPGQPQSHKIDSTEDFVDFDDDSKTQNHRAYEQLTLWEEIKAECDLVWRAYKMVLKSWINLPFTVGGIFVMELNRLWNFWLGLPVPPRSWDLKFPTRDEL